MVAQSLNRAAVRPRAMPPAPSSDCERSTNCKCALRYSCLVDGDALESVARAWWVAVDGEGWNSAEPLHDLLKADPEMFPSVIAVVVRTAPQTGPEYVGTSLLESFHYEANCHGTSNTVPLSSLWESGLGSNGTGLNAKR